MSLDTVSHLLDNPVWHALNSRHAYFAEGAERAKRYPHDMAAVTAVVNHSEAAFVEMTALFNPGDNTRLFEFVPPQEIPGWERRGTFRVDQYICETPISEPDYSVEVIELTPVDVPDMLRLARLTQPGPFEERTIEMGRHIGVREDRELVAMGGERFKLDGFCEISAVCTHPVWRGRGYARLVTSVLGHAIQKRGDVPFLHVFPDNTPAVRLYESMGFHRRREMSTVLFIRE